MLKEFINALEDILGTDISEDDSIFVTHAFNGTMIAASAETADEAGFSGRYVSPAAYVQWWKNNHGDRMPELEYAGEGFVKVF